MSLFTSIANLFNNNSPLPTPVEASSLDIDTVQADVSTTAQSDKTVTVNVRFKLTSQPFTVKVGSTMRDLFSLVQEKFNIGDVAQLTLLNEATNEAKPYAEVADKVISVEDDNASYSTEQNVGTAG